MKNLSIEILDRVLNKAEIAQRASEICGELGSVYVGAFKYCSSFIDALYKLDLYE